MQCIMNKTNKNIDPNNNVTFTLTNQDLGKFVVTGALADVAPIYDSLQADYKAFKPPVVQTVATAVTPVETAPFEPVLASGLLVEAQTLLYDYAHGTAFRSELHRQRQERRNLRYAQSLGILATDVCKKHAGVINKLRAIQ
jgi:hypothetical protein